MLQVGTRAPEFKLRGLDGTSLWLPPHGSPLTLALFFKTTCPTCQYAWPYYERLHTAYNKAGLRVLGISQHDAERTSEYQAQYGATFPHLIDAEFRASRAFDPPIVPTGFLIDARGSIIETVESWSSERVNALSEHIAKELVVDVRQIVRPQDNALANKIG